MSQEMLNTMFASFNDYSKQTGYTKSSFDAIMETFEKQVGQMIDYNKQLYVTLGKNFGGPYLDMAAFNEKFEEKIGYLPEQFVELSIQDMLDHEKIKMKIHIEKAA